MSIDTETGRQATLGEKLDALQAIIGHQVPKIRFSGAYLADKLGIGEGQLARKRTGAATVTAKDMGRLVLAFGIEKQVDYRVFELPTVDAFLDALRAAGVGSYEAVARSQLCALLQNASGSSACQLRLVAVRQPITRAGGLTPSKGADEGLPVLRVGGSARIACKGPVGRHLLVLNVDPDGEVDILMPSDMAPEARTSEAETILPTNREYDSFTVEEGFGYFRLHAAWVDDTVAEVVRKALDREALITSMTDRLAAALCALLAPGTEDKPRPPLMAATLEYKVVR